MRRRRNKIEGFLDDNQSWISSKEGIKKVVVDYFKNLFTDSDSLGIPNTWPKLFPMPNENDMKSICDPVTTIEIKEALFGIGKFKALGSDGMPAIFFQDCWQICKHDVQNLVFSSFEAAKIPQNLNETFIALVPKTDSPISINQIRPINLCNTLYKIISKILVNRIRPLLNDITNPAQASFIPGRQITNNIVIAQEIVNKYRRPKSKKGLLAWKIDLSKAYDWLSWKFISDTLNEIGFERKTINLIMRCFSNCFLLCSG